MDGWGIATAVGTIAAALVPATLYLFERNERKKERDDRKAAQTALDTELRRQATDSARRERERIEAEVRRISVWGRGTGGVANEGADAWPLFDITVTNHSGDPIYDVQVSTSVGVLHTTSRHGWDTIAPEVTHVVHATYTADGPSEFRQFGPQPQVGVLRCSVDFTDVRGRRWRRHSDGEVAVAARNTSKG